MRHALGFAALFAALTATPAMAQELTVWDWKSGDPVTSGYFAKVKADFEAAHPGVTVKYVMQPHDQYYTLLGTALSSAGGPDLILLHGGAQARERVGAMVKLDDKVADIRGDIKGWEEFTGKDGAVYAVPLSIQGFVVYYNKTLYKNAWLDPESPPRTWNELKKACDAIKAKGDVPCFTLGNKEGFGAEFFFSSMAANSFSDAEQAEWAAGKLKWSSPQVKAILQAWVDTQAWGWYAEGANSTAKFMDEYEAFMRGEGANTIGLISDVAHWKQFDEFLGAENVGVFKPLSPTLASDKKTDDLKFPLSGGIGYAVNNKSPNANLAIDLAKAFAAPAAMQVFFHDAGAIAANTKVDTSTLASPSAKAIIGWMATSGAPTAHTNMTTAEIEEWHRQSQLLLNGAVTVDAAAARMDEVQAQARAGR
ncbi:extracellular solute-binding protein [Labrys sp. LIt4]|uniref:ABC transporter substrate-binding protein n=1 Tax=Labrys sp. LIt4 TaxID=2821355 RepID=UPI001ADEF143|nr:extracellular solute-binding protein [Labrys sp. LIt4]MBP0582801.1 extracellular solute-binding protein [Labrys sp. LIt4]